MSAISDFLEARLASFFFKNNAAGLLTPGDALYVALFTADTGLETNAPTAEVVGASYARQQVAAIGWTDNADGSVENAGTVDFGTTTEAWGTVTHFAVMDALTAGNVLFQGALGTSRAIASGDPVQFPAGALIVSFD